MAHRLPVDEGRLTELLGRVIGDLGATTTAGGVVIGHRLGLYRRAGLTGPATRRGPRRAHRHRRRVTSPSGSRGQAAGGYVEYDPATGRFSMTEEQAFTLADPDGPLYLPGAFLFALGALRARAEDHRGVPHAAPGWAGTSTTTTCSLGCELFFRPGYVANLVSHGSRRSTGWRRSSPGRPGCRRRLRRTEPRRSCWPRRSRQSPFSGSDYHAVSIERARKRAAEAGVADRVGLRGRHRRSVLGHRLRPGRHLRLPARHGRSGRRRAARPRRARRRRHLDDRRAVRRRPGRRQPQPGRPRLLRVLHLRLRAQRRCPRPAASPRRPGRRGSGPRQIATDAGFTRFRRVAETPFNIVYEARP